MGTSSEIFIEKRTSSLTHLKWLQIDNYFSSDFDVLMVVNNGAYLVTVLYWIREMM